MRRALPCLLILAFLIPPGSALAQGVSVTAPPGNSAADEYVETVPTAKGGKSSTVPPRVDATGGPGTDSAAGVAAAAGLSRAAVRSLSKTADGRRVVGLAQANQGSSGGGRIPAEPSIDTGGAAGRDGLLSAISTAAGGHDLPGGMGSLFPVLLLSTAVLGLLAAGLRWRRR